MVIWNRPLLIITKIISYLRLISFLMLFLSLITTAIWVKKHDIISNIDEYYYNKKILHAKKQYKLIGSTIDSHKKIDILHEFIQQTSKEEMEAIRDLTIKLISEHLKSGNYEAAYKEGEKWIKKYPMDIEVQLKIAKILELSQENEEKIFSIYDNLFGKYNNVRMVANDYTDYLFSTGKLRKAIDVSNTFFRNASEIYIDKTYFKLYYLENNDRMFTDTNSTIFDTSNITDKPHTPYSKNKINLSFSKKYNKLKQFRLDIENIFDLQARFISDVIVTLEPEFGDTINYKVDTPLFFHEIKILPDKKGFQAENLIRDPFILLNLPSSFHNYTGWLKINIEFLYHTYLLPEQMMLFLTDSQWKISYFSTENDTELNSTQNIELILQDHFLYADISIPDISKTGNIVTIQYPTQYKFSYKNIFITAQYPDNERITFQTKNIPPTDNTSNSSRNRFNLITTDNYSYTTILLPKKGYQNITIKITI